MTWNYRVVRMPADGSETGEIYTIVEAHYDVDEDGKVNDNLMAITNPITVESETYLGLKDILTKMLNDVERFKDEVIDQISESADDGAFVEDPLAE